MMKVGDIFYTAGRNVERLTFFTVLSISDSFIVVQEICDKITVENDGVFKYYYAAPNIEKIKALPIRRKVLTKFGDDIYLKIDNRGTCAFPFEGKPLLIDVKAEAGRLNPARRNSNGV